MFKVGDKVIPLTKTRGCMEYESEIFQKFVKGKVPYLYVTLVSDDGEKLSCATQKGEYGDNFYKTDLIPYAVDPDKAFDMLITGLINDEQYKVMVGER